jgi:predicted Zn-dependent peptidase
MLGLESMSSRMSRIAKDYLYFGKVSSIDEVIRRVERVSADDILRVARQACAHERFSSVRIDPAQE